MNLQLRPIRSSLGKKYVMAVTGLLLIGFVITHMAGNLLVFAGPDALNTYAQTLKARPPLLWAARAGLLLVFVLHLWFAVRLTRENMQARPTRYVYEDTLQASWASRHMMLTGLVLLAFILYHLAHFTLGVVKPATVQAVPGQPDYQFREPKNYLDLHEVYDAQRRAYEPETSDTPGRARELKGDHATPPSVRHDVYSMVINGFRNPWITASYLLAMAFLGLHLWHGGSSWFQSLGLAGPRFSKFARAVGPVLAVAVVAGNCSIPLAVWLGIVH